MGHITFTRAADERSDAPSDSLPAAGDGCLRFNRVDPRWLICGDIRTRSRPLNPFELADRAGGR